MKAHIVGGGLAGLAAATYLIRGGGLLPGNVVIYETAPELGGAMGRTGTAAEGYILPTGRIFEAQYRCAFDLFSQVPSVNDPAISIRDDIRAFNERWGTIDRTHLLDHDLKILREPHFGLSLRDRLDLLKLAVTPEPLLDNRTIDTMFTPGFFKTEFWLLWTTLMGCLPQHGAVELRRYLHRFLHLLPDISRMTNILRTRYNQDDAIIRPITSWLHAQGVVSLTGTRVIDIGFIPARDRITASSLTIQQGERTEVIDIDPDDVVLMTNGSQTEALTIGSMKTPPPAPPSDTETCALWRRLALQRPEFGTPGTFFGPQHIKDTAWITFTVTAPEPTFLDLMSALTASEAGRGGLVTLVESNWLVTVAIFHQPEFLDQPGGTKVWWGYGLFPHRPGNLVRKPMTDCSGAEILREVLHHLKFERHAEEIVGQSICVPCLLPYAGSVWLPRSRTSRPRVVPESSTNFGFIGQFAELPLDTMFTMEYSVRTAWHAVATLRAQGRKPPPVYQGNHDLAALRDALAALT